MMHLPSTGELLDVKALEEGEILGLNETAVAPHWVAVYLGRAVTYSSKEEAERLSTPDRIALLPVTFDPKELSDHDLCLAI